mmetsp:Transcript_25020/g.80654  ORF Transcript_25020/g.80654 Transcript_25020/m.80654 type:complete len:87 (-) Transcript_25020:1706-1966(-)
MAKKKKALRKVVKKKKPTVATVFKCPICASEKAVNCAMDREAGIGRVSCSMCGAKFETSIHYLSEPVDVFGEWIDALEKDARGLTE